MQLEQAEQKVVYTNLKGEQIPFSIGDATVIIDIIRKKMYSYPIQTLVQEYLSNARDACYEIGRNGSHIDVTLPTYIKPEFIVRDHGIGMSEDTVYNIFVKYGISTKRTSKSQLGCFGIGAKSAWAYTDSFIVENFYRGVHTRYLADVGENQQGRLLTVEKKPTTEDNGILIKIPVKTSDINWFKKSYIRATMFWTNKPNVVSLTSEYPKVAFSIKGLTLYYVDGGGTELYLNANGIPFSAHTLSHKYAKVGYIVAVDIDPSKLGISANREGYVNQDYASKQIEKSYDKLTQYVLDTFKSLKPCEYLAQYKKFKGLNDISELFFKDKPYKPSGSGVMVALIIDEGFFHQLTYRGVWNKLNTKIFRITDKAKGYLSRCKIRENETLSTTTKKSIVNAKRAIYPISFQYVFFQGNLSDKDYTEISEVLGISKYVEDIFAKTVKAPISRTHSDKTGIRVRLFKNNTFSCVREVRSRDLLELLKEYPVLFYSDVCSQATLSFVTRYLKGGVFYISQQSEKRLDALNSPKVIPLANLDSYVKKSERLLQKLSDTLVYLEKSWYWKRISNHFDFGFDLDFDLGALKASLLESIRVSFGGSEKGLIYNILTSIKRPPSILEEFSNKYPLILQEFGSSSYMDEMLFYMKAKDKLVQDDKG